MNKICPNCSKEFGGLAKYCTKCGVELTKVPNRCSAMKTALCKDARFADDDVYCAYCGALTTYAVRERQADGNW